MCLPRHRSQQALDTAHSRLFLEIQKSHLTGSKKPTATHITSSIEPHTYLTTEPLSGPVHLSFTTEL